MFELDSFTTSFQNEDGSGILLIDKPTGMTSHDVVGHIRRQAWIKCVGHAGTLDPLATGLLIVLVGRHYTKLQDQFMKQDKEYECTVELGRTTDTYDSEGEVTSQAEWEKVAQVSQTDVQIALESFSGDQLQTVPIYSAVKVHGRRLYKFALKQKKVVLPKRQVTMYNIELMVFRQDQVEQKTTVSFRVACSSGTYIRSLAHDLGQVLGVGATVVALRRTKIGKLNVADAKTI